MGMNPVLDGRQDMFERRQIPDAVVAVARAVCQAPRAQLVFNLGGSVVDEHHLLNVVVLVDAELLNDRWGSDARLAIELARGVALDRPLHKAVGKCREVGVAWALPFPFRHFLAQAIGHTRLDATIVASRPFPVITIAHRERTAASLHRATDRSPAAAEQPQQEGKNLDAESTCRNGCVHQVKFNATNRYYTARG